ncbi:MAG: cysteine--tRNA ligase [Actinomycetota bacterium]
MVALYDTAARDVVEIKPSGDTLTMYTCGPTVYRYAHIGNLRTFLLPDLIARAFDYQGTGVRAIQNITDVGHMTDELFDGGEDRMLLAAGIENRSPEEIAAYYTDFYFRDIEAFNLRRAESYPRASDHISHMIELIVRLIERGHAYEVGGNVYYDVTSFPSYGNLSRNSLEELQQGHRNVEADPNKRHHADFLLWKAAGPKRVIHFPSPWGDGYPGWHIECSAMSLAHLGDEFDVHTGGVDLIFPHHEDEIAQSEGATGSRVVRHWVHSQHLLAEGRKMSKSAENFFDVRDLEKRGHTDPLAFRLLCLQTRYRAQFNFTFDALSGAERTLDRWRRLVADWSDAPAPSRAAGGRFEERFLRAMNADLDTPTIVALIAEVIGTADLDPADKVSLLQGWDRFLGLDLARDAGKELHLPGGASELIEQRERARASKDWSESDRLRTELSELGVEIEDTPSGPKPRITR